MQTDKIGQAISNNDMLIGFVCDKCPLFPDTCSGEGGNCRPLAIAKRQAELLRSISPEEEECNSCTHITIKPGCSYGMCGKGHGNRKRTDNCHSDYSPASTLHDIQSQPEEDIWDKHVTPKPETTLTPSTNKCTLCMGHRDLIDSCKHCGGTGKEAKAEMGLRYLHGEVIRYSPSHIGTSSRIRTEQYITDCHVHIDNLEETNRTLAAILKAKAKPPVEPKAEDFEQWFTLENQNIDGHYDGQEESLCKLVWEARQEEIDRLGALKDRFYDMQVDATKHAAGVFYANKRLTEELTEAKQDAKAFENSLRQKKAALDGCRAENRELKAHRTKAAKDSEPKAETGELSIDLPRPVARRMTAGIMTVGDFKISIDAACDKIEIQHDQIDRLKEELADMHEAKDGFYDMWLDAINAIVIMIDTNKRLSDELIDLKRALGE